MDMAASEFYIKEENLYDLDFKNLESDGSKKITPTELVKFYQQLHSKYPIISIEDPFDQDDFEVLL